MRVALAGAVDVSKTTLEALLASELEVVGVLGLEPRRPQSVVGYQALAPTAEEGGVPYAGFQKLNDDTVVRVLRGWAPDLLFVVGLSQIVGPELLSLPTHGCVGFHPTRLPDGRGRAPVPWIILTGRHGAATFFMMDDGADTGPILVQEPFEVADGDYAEDVHDKINVTVKAGMATLCNRLAAGNLDSTPQDESAATTYGRRGPEDGLIDWSLPAEDIARLVRATSRPYPGAFCLTDAGKIVLWRAVAVDDKSLFAVPGTVMRNDRSGVLVQAGQGQLLATELETRFDEEPRLSPLRPGGRLTASPWDRIKALERRVNYSTEPS